MSDISTIQKMGQETLGRKQLVGKVVLLIGNDTTVLNNLVTQLAQKGADIVLLCWQLPLEAAQKILLIEQSKEKPTTSRQLIETIVTELGHLDIFIDLSAQKNLSPQNGNGTMNLAGANRWQLTKAILEELNR